MHRRHLFVRATAVAIIGLSTAGRGRTEPAPVAARSASEDARRATPAGGYTYAFKDDLLDAGGLGADEERIRVASHAIRTTLIRPRTAFIAELLKTVENL